MAPLVISRIHPTIRLDAPGRHIGHLAVPYSDDAHAYATIPVPIAVLNGTPGPTTLLTAGVHGDEYEGPVALRHLIQSLDPAALKGRLIILPALNLPAVRAATRCSPIDGANMNRAFPGHPDGGPTAQIAHYVETHLLPLCQAALDLHSGGRAADYLPCAYVYEGGPHEAEKRALAQAFGAPLATLVGATAETRSLSAAAERQGVPMIAAELGGGTCISAAALHVAKSGTNAVLQYLGHLPNPQPRTTTFIRIPDRTHHLMCPADGLFEPQAQLGDTIHPGTPAGLLHPEDPAIPPIPITFNTTGLVIVRRLPAQTRRGDHLYTTALPLPPSEVVGSQHHPQP